MFQMSLRQGEIFLGKIWLKGENFMIYQTGSIAKKNTTKFSQESLDKFIKYI